MGELCPSPTALRQRTLGASFQRRTVSREEPSRRGPSHCGQSSADAIPQKRTRKARERNRGIVVSSIVRGLASGGVNPPVLASGGCEPPGKSKNRGVHTPRSPGWFRK